MNAIEHSTLRAAIERRTAPIISRGNDIGSTAYQDAVELTVDDYVKNTLHLEGPLAEEAASSILIDLFEQENGLQ
ncbi:MAG: hypothetical protein ACAH80_02350 [Alphaproteobacteria bacterium]